MSLPIIDTILYTGNGSSNDIQDGRTFSWVVGASPSTPWIPPFSGETAARRFIQANTGTDYYFDKYININAVGYLMRMFNFHVIGGYPEWFCAGATSAVALDIFPAGSTDNGTDGVNGRTAHSRPFLQWQLWGGGTWSSADQCFHNVPKLYKQYEFDLNTYLYLRFHAKFNTDGTGFMTAWVNGTLWFDAQNISLLYPPVAGLVGGNAGGDLLEGLYEATDRRPNLEAFGRMQHTLSRWGIGSIANMVADVPTISFGDRSVIIPGVGTQQSVSFLTGTTIEDTGGGGGGAPAPTAPTPSFSPFITGNPQVGAILSVTAAFTGTAPITQTYQWERSIDAGATSTPIVGATSSTYTPVVADTGALLRINVTGTNATGTASARSAYTVPIRAQGTSTPLVIGKETFDPAAFTFLSLDRERANSFTLSTPGQLVSMYARINGLGGTTGVGQIRLAIYDDTGPGTPNNLLAVTNIFNVPAGMQPTNVQFTPTTTPSLLPQALWLTAHTGGDPVIEGYFEAGVGLLRFVSDVFADGTDFHHASWSTGDGVMTIWATFTPVAYPFEALEETHGGITQNVFRGNDGGAVLYSSLNSAASDAARGLLCDAVNPSRIHTVHQRASSDYAFYARVPSAPAPPNNWWV